MKILKSGIETTPEELSKIKGGIRCACGCEGGYNSGQLWGSASNGGGCICGCTTTRNGESVFNSPSFTAQDYPF